MPRQSKSFKAACVFNRFLRVGCLKILLYEHVSGGGYAEQTMDLSVLSEGFGMLRCLAADFKAAGHEVTIFLDGRIARLNPPTAADRVIPVFHLHQAEALLADAAKTNDAVYVVAPETGQTLESLLRLVEESGKVSFNCEARAVHRVADKTFLYDSLKSRGLSTPETLIFDVGASVNQVKSTVRTDLAFPLVIKPADGVSCGGLSVACDGDQIGDAIVKATRESAAGRFVVQEYVHGDAASVSLLCTGTEASAISLNRQNLRLATPDADSSYVGGEVPFNHPLRQEALAAAEKVALSFPGLRGYVGVDLVLAEDKPFVVDVNARLTTSYIGLSRVAGFNVAEAIVTAVLKGKLPSRQEFTGFACFSKVELSKPPADAFQKAARIDGVISPPFSLDDHAKSISLVNGYGKSAAEAGLRFEEAKKRLLTIINGGK